MPPLTWRAGRSVTGAVLGGMLFLAAASLHAQAVDEVLGRVVTEATVMSGGRIVRDPSVLALVETRVGQALSMREVRETLTHLFALGRYDDVRFTAGRQAEQVSLRYELIPRVVVERVELSGEGTVSRDELREAITLTHGAAFEVDRIPAVADTVTRFYRARGFINAQVATRVEGTGPSRTLRVEATPGPPARIAQISLTGVGITQRPIMLARLGLADGQPYDGVEIERRLAELESELRAQRFYEVETGPRRRGGRVGADGRPPPPDSSRVEDHHLVLR